jgi:hypothetical protein
MVVFQVGARELEPAAAAALSTPADWRATFLARLALALRATMSTHLVKGGLEDGKCETVCLFHV